MEEQTYKTLLIGETVKWISNKKRCVGIVRDDLNTHVIVLRIQKGNKKSLKKVRIRKELLITKQQEKMDVKKVLIQGRFKKKSKEDLLEIMENGTLKPLEKEVIAEILITDKGVKADDIPNYDPPVKKKTELTPGAEVEEEVKIDYKESVLPFAESLETKDKEAPKKEPEKKIPTTPINKTQRKDIFHIDPRLLSTEPGFNTRIDYGDIDELKNSIIQNGVIIPIRGYKEGDKFMVVDGHRRHRATIKAITEGHDIARVPFISEKKKTEEERIFGIILSNDGKQLAPLELGEAYKRLISHGYNYTEIANRIGRTIKHVSDMASVAESSKEIKEVIKVGNVSATLVSEVKNAIKDDDLAEKIIIDKSVEKKKIAEESGKKIDEKVTKKDLKDVIEKQKDNSKSVPHKDVDEIQPNLDFAVEKVESKMYSEAEVKDLLRKQIDACKAVLPAVLKSKLNSVDIVLN